MLNQIQADLGAQLYGCQIERLGQGSDHGQFAAMFTVEVFG